MNGPDAVATLYAYVVVNVDGTETVPVLLFPEWGPIHVPVQIPLVVASLGAAALLRRNVLSDPSLAGKIVKLIRYDRVAPEVDLIDRTREKGTT